MELHGTETKLKNRHSGKRVLICFHSQGQREIRKQVRSLNPHAYEYADAQMNIHMSCRQTANPRDSLLQAHQLFSEPRKMMHFSGKFAFYCTFFLRNMKISTLTPFLANG